MFRRRNADSDSGQEVGAADFTLGAGIPFFAPRHGFVCDIVKNFEIVLGNGIVTNANSAYNPDLFKPLKGGSGSIGLVTRFDFPLSLGVICAVAG